MENDLLNTNITRRSFVLGVAATSTGVLLGFFPSVKSDAKFIVNDGAKVSSLSPSVYLEIKPDGSVIITNSRSEMGQGTRTTFAMILSDELDADWSKVSVVQAPGD